MVVALRSPWLFLPTPFAFEQDCLARSSKEVCLKRYDPQQLIKGMYSEFVEVGVLPIQAYEIIPLW
jgi:hypothetical protein